MKKKQLISSVKIKAVDAVIKHGQSVESVAVAFGVHRSNIYRWLNRHHKTKSLERIRNPKSGRQAKIAGKDTRKLLSLLMKPATQFGFDTELWTTRRIIQVLKKKEGIEVSRMALHRTLKKCRQSYKKPETRYYEADEGQQEKWKSQTVPQIKEIVRKKRAILYFEDESNISLTPVIGKTWGPIGSRVIKKITGNRGSVSAISAISKSGHLIFNLHRNNKRYNADDIVNFLKQMMAHHSRRHLVVVMDQAPAHTAKKVKEFVAKQKRLDVFYLPPRSPEFNPDEKLWNHLKNHELKSHAATQTKALMKLAKSKLVRMSKDKKLILGIYLRSEGATLFA